MATDGPRSVPPGSRQVATRVYELSLSVVRYYAHYYCSAMRSKQINRTNDYVPPLKILLFENQVRDISENFRKFKSHIMVF